MHMVCRKMCEHCVVRGGEVFSDLLEAKEGDIIESALVVNADPDSDCRPGA